MGNTASSLDYMSFMARLTQRDVDKEDTFWTEILSLAPQRTELSIPSSRLMNEIAHKYPENLKKLLDFCGNYLELMSGAEANAIVPQNVRNQISVVLSIFSMGIVVLVSDKDNEGIFNSIKDSLIPRFIKSCNKCMYIKNLCVFGETEYWKASQCEPGIHLLRRDFLHSVLIMFNISKIAKYDVSSFQIDVQLSSSLFINSLCQYSYSFVRSFNYGNDFASLIDFLKNGYALMAKISLIDPEFGSAISEIPNHLAVGAFTGSKSLTSTSILSFNPVSPITSESLTFLYLVSLYKPDFAEYLATNGVSNIFIADLLLTMQNTYESVGFCYLHSIVVSTILILTYPPQGAKLLNEQFTSSFQSSYRPHRGSYADLLIEIMSNFADNDSLISSIICLFHHIAPYLTNSTLYSSFRLLQLFEKLNSLPMKEKNRRMIELLLETFAKIIQTKPLLNTNMLILISQKAHLFKKLKTDNIGFNASLDIILKFLSEAKRVLIKNNKRKLSTDEAVEAIKQINTDELFPTVTVFDDHPHVFEGEMKDTFLEWSNLLFMRTFDTETEKLKILKLL